MLSENWSSFIFRPRNRSKIRIQKLHTMEVSSLILNLDLFGKLMIPSLLINSAWNDTE
jgi:hypothetical protein